MYDTTEIVGEISIQYLKSSYNDIHVFIILIFYRASNEILLVSPTQRRPDAVEHLRLLEKCYNANIIRRLSLGVVSVIWVDNYSDMCNTYECTCSYLELSYIDFFKRIIDIGFINKWWLLEKRMEDFDVND